MSEQFYIKPKNGPGISLGEGSAHIGLSENHTFGNDVVSQPLEDGTSLFDHIVVLPDELEVVIHTGNSPRGGDRYPSQVLYAQLKELRNKRELMDVYTLHEIYRDMAIKDVTVPNTAPFPGRTDITIKFVRISIVQQITNEFPRDRFEPPQITTNGETAAKDLTEEQKKIIQEKAIQEASNGRLSDPTEVADGAMSQMDMGEGEIFGGFNESWQNIDLDESLEQDVDGEVTLYDQFQNAIDSVYNAPVTEAAKTAQATIKNIVTSLSSAYARTGNFTEAVRNKIQKVATGISLISNLSIGAQRFVRTIKGQVFGIASYFDVLTNNWKMDLTDGQGRDIVTGAALVVGVNLIQGLNLTYTKIDSNGVETKEPLAIKGLFMTAPIPSNSASPSAIPSLNTPSTVAKGIESSPYAFSPGKNGIAPCSILIFDTEEAAQAYAELVSGAFEKEMNFDIDEMDYQYNEGT